MLELQKISFEITGRNKILDNLSLSISDGDFVAITGPNGSGKSTLAQIIMGILKPTSGKVFFNNQDITRFSINERAKAGIAFSFQQPIKFKGLSIFDLLFVASNSTISKKESEKILRKVELDSTNYLEREVDSSLSGGELKRIEIATVLARNANLLIFDEPEAGIDLWSFEKITKIFKKLHEEGKTIVVISHQEKILRIADRIAVIETGKIKVEGKTEKILAKVLEKKNEF